MVVGASVVVVVAGGGVAEAARIQKKFLGRQRECILILAGFFFQKRNNVPQTIREKSDFFSDWLRDQTSENHSFQ